MSEKLNVQTLTPSCALLIENSSWLICPILPNAYIMPYTYAYYSLISAVFTETVASYSLSVLQNLSLLYNYLLPLEKQQKKYLQ
jgi:hypothetical protein